LITRHFLSPLRFSEMGLALAGMLALLVYCFSMNYLLLAVGLVLFAILTAWQMKRWKTLRIRVLQPD